VAIANNAALTNFILFFFKAAPFSFLLAAENEENSLEQV